MHNTSIVRHFVSLSRPDLQMCWFRVVWCATTPTLKRQLLTKKAHVRIIIDPAGVGNIPNGPGTNKDNEKLTTQDRKTKKSTRTTMLYPH